MRAVVQRVSHARVTIDGAVSGAIERGLLVYLGVGRGDADKERAWMLDKILGLRIFPTAQAELAYDAFVREAKARIHTETGRFGADMKVESLNDGPVTIWLETP